MSTKTGGSTVNYKLICWDDFAIPVPLEMNWMAIDRDGTIWVSRHKPVKEPAFNWWVLLRGSMDIIVPSGLKVPPPEPGPWKEQLYWIGD